jgi:hypothetical protein
MEEPGASLFRIEEIGKNMNLKLLLRVAIT